MRNIWRKKVRQRKRVLLGLMVNSNDHFMIDVLAVSTNIYDLIETFDEPREWWNEQGKDGMNMMLTMEPITMTVYYYYYYYYYHHYYL